MKMKKIMWGGVIVMIATVIVSCNRAGTAYATLKNMIDENDFPLQIDSTITLEGVYLHYLYDDEILLEYDYTIDTDKSISEIFVSVDRSLRCVLGDVRGGHLAAYKTNKKHSYPWGDEYDEGIKNVIRLCKECGVKGILYEYRGKDGEEIGVIHYSMREKSFIAYGHKDIEEQTYSEVDEVYSGEALEE